MNTDNIIDNIVEGMFNPAYFAVTSEYGELFPTTVRHTREEADAVLRAWPGNNPDDPYKFGLRLVTFRKSDVGEHFCLRIFEDVK